MNPEWKAKAGEGTAVNWPTGAGGKGNEGVSAFVQRLPNSIGYVEYAYAKQNKLTAGQMKNKAGKFVEPTDTSFKAAAAGAGQGAFAHERVVTVGGEEFGDGLVGVRQVRSGKTNR